MCIGTLLIIQANNSSRITAGVGWETGKGKEADSRQMVYEKLCVQRKQENENRIGKTVAILDKEIL